MEFIAHQINTIEELKCVPKEYGIEVDLRDYGDRLILLSIYVAVTHFEVRAEYGQVISIPFCAIINFI